MHPYRQWRFLWIGLVAACTPHTATLITTPVPTAILRSLPTQPTLPTATPLVLTSLPSTSHGPTATPMVHTVREGDTLLGIAGEHGVTVDALQAVNGGLDPLSLQPGQTLVVPLVETDHGSAVLPKPSPLPLTVSSFRCYSSPAGGHLCLGEVRNGTTDPIINLAVQVAHVLESSSITTSRAVFSSLDILWPGQSQPLAVRIAGSARGAAPQVLSAESGAALADIFAELDVQELSGGSRDPAGYLVSGQVFNEGELIASEIKVVVTLYGVDGNVRAFRQVYLTDPLPPRAGSTFRVEFLERPEEVRRYTAVAQGRLAKSN